MVHHADDDPGLKARLQSLRVGSENVTASIAIKLDGGEARQRSRRGAVDRCEVRSHRVADERQRDGERERALNDQNARVNSALIDLGVPPWFVVQTEDLDRLVAHYRDLPADYAGV